MKDRLVLVAMAPILAPVLVLILALSGGRALADDSDTSATDPDGAIALAEHLTTFAHQTFHQKKIPTKALQIDAALYRAASSSIPPNQGSPAPSPMCFCS